MTTPPDGLLRHNGRIVGYLFDFGGQGVYSPDGHTQYRPDQVDAHNAALAQAELRGLDEACQVGQCGTFYLNPKVGVTTFTGVKVADYTRNGNSITFRRAGRVYRGRLQKDADCFNFRRVR